MLSIKNITTCGWAAAFRGMRNPLNSWDKADSFFFHEGDFDIPILGKNDTDLALRLCKGGSEHRKFLRMIHIQMDVTAPDYFFKEFSTYRVGVTENSTSTMHKIAAKEFTLDDFSHEHLIGSNDLSFYDPYEPLGALCQTIDVLNDCRDQYLATKDKKRWWWQMIQLLPMSYNYTRTIDMSYETALNILHQRQNHKLDEWHIFCDKLLELPFTQEFYDAAYGDDHD